MPGGRSERLVGVAEDGFQPRWQKQASLDPSGCAGDRSSGPPVADWSAATCVGCGTAQIRRIDCLEGTRFGKLRQVRSQPIEYRLRALSSVPSLRSGKQHLQRSATYPVEEWT